MSLKDIYCQDKAIGFLQRSFAAGKSTHAYIFAGDEGVGKGMSASTGLPGDGDEGLWSAVLEGRSLAPLAEMCPEVALHGVELRQYGPLTRPTISFMARR